MLPSWKLLCEIYGPFLCESRESLTHANNISWHRASTCCIHQNNLQKVTWLTDIHWNNTIIQRNNLMKGKWPGRDTTGMAEKIWRHVYQICILHKWLHICDKRGAKDTRGTFKLIGLNKLTTPWLKIKKTNRQIIVYMTQHRKLKTKQHEPHKKLGVI